MSRHNLASALAVVSFNSLGNAVGSSLRSALGIILAGALAGASTGGCQLYIGDPDGGGSGAMPVPDGPGSPAPTPAPPPAPVPPDADDPGQGTPGGTCPGLAGAEVILDCDTAAGYEVDSWRAERVSGPALHLVSVYQTRSDHRPGYHPTGEAFVHFALSGANVLALSAYEPTHWNVTLAPGASLDRIVVVGYHLQSVSAPAGVAVDIHDAESTGRSLAACGYSLPYNSGGCDTDQLIALVEAITDLPLASFDGCYHASTFQLEPAGCAPRTGDVIQDCDTGAFSWRPDNAPASGLYVGAVYETRSDHGPGYHPTGEATVIFDRPGPNVLALSAYEPTDWKIDLTPGAGLSKVLVFGYHTQNVLAPEGVPVEIHDYESTASPLAACGYSLPYNGGGCDTDQLLANAERAAGMPVVGFDGCYRATRFHYAADQ